MRLPLFFVASLPTTSHHSSMDDLPSTKRQRTFVHMNDDDELQSTLQRPGAVSGLQHVIPGQTLSADTGFLRFDLLAMLSHSEHIDRPTDQPSSYYHRHGHGVVTDALLLSDMQRSWNVSIGS
jgi:hypothetical protein